MIAVVTGSSGFIGSHLVKALLERGAVVRCLDLAHRDGVLPSHPRIERFTVDCADLQAVMETPALVGADYVFHLAGVTKRATLAAFRAGNVLPTQNLLKALHTRRVQLRRFVLVSSQAAAGPAQSLDCPVTETDAPQPMEAYGRSKLEAERVVQSYADRIPSTIIRPCSVYGPRDVDFLQVFRQVSHGWGIYPGCRDRYLSLIFVGDLVSGVVQAAEAPAAVGKAYFLCADGPLCWRDLYQAIAGVMGARIVEWNIPQWAIDWAGRAGDGYSRLSGRYSLVNSQKIALSRPRYWVCSSEQARRDFGFAARASLQEGVEITCRWYVEHGWLGKRRWPLASIQPGVSQAR